MLLNYLKVAVRGLRKNGAQSLNTLISLALGFTCCLAIGVYVHSELTYDHFHENRERIYRVTYDETSGEIPGFRHLATVGPPVGPAMKATFPAVAEFVRLRFADVRTIRVGDKQFYEQNVYFADPAIFEVFTFPFLAGDPSTALNLNNAAVITREMALKYFGHVDVLGKTITMDNSSQWKITGVLESLPANSHLEFGVLLPFDAFRVPPGYPVTLQDWGWISFHTFIMVDPQANAEDLERQLPALAQRHFEGDRAKKFRFRLQPLTDIYMGDVKHAQVASGNMSYVYGLACAALLIFVAAGFNYMNLFTAVSLSRAREISVRKVAGAKRHSIVFQFLLESVLTTCTAMAISLVLLGTLRPLINDVTGIGIPEAPSNSILIAIAFGIALGVGLLSGCYPSLLLSSLEAGKTLKGNFRVNPAGVRLRKSMVMVQFIACTAILTAVFVIHGQVNFLRSKHLGFAKNELLLLRLDENELTAKYNLLRNRLLANPHVEMVAVGGHRMDGENGNVPIYVGGAEEGIAMSIDAVKHFYFKTAGISLLAGREFDERFPADSAHGVIINATAAKLFGWSPEEALGQSIRVGAIVTQGEVIGVVRDFHFGPLHSEIKPLVVYYPRTLLENIYVRLKKDVSPATVISTLEKMWITTIPDFPFDFTFLSEHLNDQYRDETRFSSLFFGFACIAIVIACFGLYAVVTQEVIFRVKEIGIRKVLGASTSAIFGLIASKFLWQVLAASVIGAPLVWYLLERWLNGFAYRDSLTLQPFVAAATITIGIAFLTVVKKTVAASLANPVDSIRCE